MQLVVIFFSNSDLNEAWGEEQAGCRAKMWKKWALVAKDMRMRK